MGRDWGKTCVGDFRGRGESQVVEEKIWITRDGRRMRLIEMMETHLQNAIRFLDLGKAGL